MTSAKQKFKINLISLAVMSALSLMASSAHGQVTAAGGCDSYDPIDGQVVLCTPKGSNPETKGVQTPEKNTTINNVTVLVQPGVTIDVNGSTIGLGSGTVVVNEGTLFTRRFRYGYGISSGVNGRSTAGGNSITNESKGRVLTDGSDAHGIYINARQTSALGNTIINRGEVKTGGARADGIRLFTTASDAQNVIDNAGSIATAGVTSHGIHVLNTLGLVEITNTGSITVTDPTSYAVYIDGSVNLLVDGALSSPGTAIFVNPLASNVQATTVTLGSQATIAGGISLSNTRTSEKLVFDGFESEDFSNSLSGVNLIEARNEASVALTASQYDFGASQITLEKDARLTIAGQLAASTSLTLDGQGELILSANNLMSADVLVNGPTLQLNASQAAGTGAIDIASGARLRLGADNLTIANDIVLRGANGIDAGSFSATLAGDISGAGGLTKEGSGTLTLAGQNTYLGATNILQGALILNASGALPASDVAIASGASLQINNLNQAVGAISGQGDIELGTGTLTTTVSGQATFGGSILGGGGLVKQGSGTLTLSGENQFTGTTTVAQGQLATLGDDRLAAGTSLLVQDGATFVLGGDQTLAAFSGQGDIDLGGFTLTNNMAQDQTFAGRLIGQGSRLILDGSGSERLTLTNQSEFSGTVTVENATLALDNALALGFETVVRLQAGSVLDVLQPTLLGEVILDGGRITGNDNDQLRLALLTVFKGDVNDTIEDIDQEPFGFIRAGLLKLEDEDESDGGVAVINRLMAYTGSTKIKGGIVRLAGSGGFDAKSSLIMYDGGALELNDRSQTFSSIAGEGGSIELGSASLTSSNEQTARYAGVISGTGSVIQDGVSTWILAGVNTYTGTTEIKRGVLALEQSESVGAGPILIANGATLQANNALNLVNAVTLAGDGTVATQGNNVTLAGVVSGAGKLIKDGAGVLTLEGANSYAGGTSVQAGTLALAGNTSAGAGAIALADGTTLQANDALTLANGVSLTGDSTVATQGNNVTLTGVISGAGKLIKDGGGVLTLEDANSYAGGTSVQAGTLALAGNASAGAGAIALANGTTLQANDALNLANAVTLAGDSTVATQGNDVTLAGLISGAGKLIKDGGGVLTLEGANTYAGGTSVQAGTLALAGNTSAGAGAIALADGTTLQANKALNLANAMTLTGVATIATAGNDLTFNGVISGDSLTMTGGARLTLAAQNTYTGTTTIEDGTLITAGDGNLARASSVSIKSKGALVLGGDQTLAWFEGAGALDIGDHFLTTEVVEDTTFSGKLSGNDGRLILDGASDRTMVLEGESDFDGKVQVKRSTLALNSLNALGINSIIELSDGATLEVRADTIVGAVIGERNPNPENPNITQVGGAELATLLTVTKADTINVTNTDVVFKGQTYRAGLIKVSDGSSDNGTSFIEALEKYTGVTAVLEGTLQLRAAGQLDETSSLVMYPLGRFVLNANKDQTLASIAGAGGVVDLQARTLTINGDQDTTYRGALTGSGQFVKDGPATLTLAGTSDYTGGTGILGGTLVVASQSALGTGGLTFANDAVLRTDVGLTLAGPVQLLDAGTIDTNGRNLTLNGAISGGSLTKVGEGVLTLANGQSSYAGGTLVQSGVLALSATGAAGTGQIRLANDTVLRANRAITIENAVQLQAVGAIATGEHAVTVAGVVSGAGQLKKLDSGVLTLANANTYSGGTLLEKGTIVAANDQALGTGTLIAGEFDAVLGAGKSALTLANAVRLDHDLIVDTAGELMVLSGEVSGVGRLIKRGSGVLELASDNAYLGGTVIEQGTLALDVNAAASSGTVTMASDTVLQAQASLSVGNEIKLAGPVQMNTQGFDVTLSGVIGNNSVGQLIKTGLGTLTLTGQNQYSGGTIIQEGRLAVLGSLASGVQVQAQTELAGTGTIGGDVFNAGTIAPAMGSGPSRLTIVGNYVGEGGTFATVLGGTTNAIVADQLAIEGQGNRASGRTVISVTDPTGVLGRPTVGDGILLVDVSEGATSTTDAFSAPRIAAGAYEYTLNRGGEESAQSWFLRADIDAPPPPVIVTPQVAQREEVALYPALPSLARQYLWSINGTLDDRRGAPDVLGQWQEQPIAWGRFVGQGNKTAPGNADKGPGLKTNDWALQLGADLLRSSSDWGQWRAGPVLTLGRSVGGAYNARGTVKTGDVSLNAYSLGLNATVASKHGGYADLLLMATRLTGIEARSPLGTSISTTGWAYSGSLEGGWRVAMSDRVSVTPQAQIYSTTVDLNNTADAFSRIDMATNTSLLGRLGVKLAYDNQQAQGPATTFWARASVYSTLAGKNAQTSFLNVLGTNATTFDSQAPGTWFALDAALNVQTSRNTAVQFGVGYQTSFNSQFQGVYGQVNVRYAF